MEVEVEEIINQPIKPIIVNFGNGEFCENSETKLECALFKNKLNKTIFTAYTNKMLYTGKVKSDEDLMNNFLVIKKKNSNKVRLIALDSVFLKTYVKSNSGLLDDTISNKVSNAEVNKQFGSKKTKRYTEQKERLALDIENVKEQLEKTVASYKTDEDYLLNNTSTALDTESTYKPPIDRNASSVEHVYKLEDLIPDNVMNALESEVNFVLESDDLDNIGLYEFCRLKFITFKEYASSDSYFKKCKILVIINYLLKFLGTSAKSITRKFTISETKIINFYIMDNFSMISGNQRTRPMSMRDKTICYILVLAVIVSDYSLDLEILAKDMKIGIKKLMEMGKIIGFTPKGSKNISLKLPLPAPVLPSLKRRK